MVSVLFVCRSNAGRSQTAEWIFKSLTDRHTVSSAGTSVAEEGKAGMPVANPIVAILAETGHDISSWKRKQVTKEMVQRADKVIVLMLKGEVEQYVPDYIKNSGKTEYWDVEDMRGRDIGFHRARMENIKTRVIKLVEQLG